MIGVLLPASAAGALVNIGVSMAGKVPVNLNFTAGKEAMESAAQQCRIRTIVTSKAFLVKARIEPMDGMVYVEDILKAQGGLAKLSALVAARLLPAPLLVSGRNPDAPATVIFSSGSTGVPKGVVLSHYNVIANLEAIAQVYRYGREDRIVGALPFFHSFGFTVTIWFPLIAGGAVAYHPNPLDAKAIGALVAKYRGTFLLSTPTFCTGYTRKCSREEFATLRYVLVGAEKLREPVAAAFREAFGVELMEGYGCTEMAPVVAVNAPGYEAGRDSQVGAKAGTVGKPLPGVAVRIVDPNTRELLPPGQEGLLLVKGANRMLGYLDRPELTAESVVDGWYNTGDIAAVDEDGFLRITDRLSRFSKIGGEMVPHLKVEEAVYAAIGEHRAIVTGIPDEQRGERLVVLYTRPDMTPSELWRALAATDLPKLWVPKREDIFQVDSIPVLGTGKVDLRGAKLLALECTSVGRPFRAADPPSGGSSRLKSRLQAGTPAPQEGHVV
jgi:acyl-[acyl-carrier-protein]-phospholipid O-acyltransferase/long-chain-fatty-acid--[acyl-carrier-protein] ligase